MLTRFPGLDGTGNLIEKSDIMKDGKCMVMLPRIGQGDILTEVITTHAVYGISGHFRYCSRRLSLNGD